MASIIVAFKCGKCDKTDKVKPFLAQVLMQGKCKCGVMIYPVYRKGRKKQPGEIT